jgi:hypothetical protein
MELIVYLSYSMKFIQESLLICRLSLWCRPKALTRHCVNGSWDCNSFRISVQACVTLSWWCSILFLTGFRGLLSISWLVYPDTYPALFPVYPHRFILGLFFHFPRNRISRFGQIKGGVSEQNRDMIWLILSRACKKLTEVSCSPQL